MTLPRAARAAAGAVLASAACLALAACGTTEAFTAPAPSGPVTASAAPTAAASSAAPTSSAPSATGGTGTVTATVGAGRSTRAPARALGGLGPGASLAGLRLFPASNAWNTRVDGAPVDPRSATLIASIGAGDRLHPDFGANWDGGPFGIPYVVVAGTQAKVPVRFEYADESDRGPYPVPRNAPVEGGAAADGDRHVIVVDRDHQRLYELYAAYPVDGGRSWRAGSGAVFDLRTGASRPAGWTSADAAGLPILPGLVRYDEVRAGRIDHALRFTVSRTRKGYVAPARHWASSDPSAALPPMGMRVRLKASFDVSKYPPQARVVLVALQRYGMIVADNGSDWYLSGAPDRRWDDEQLNALKNVPGSAFEVVRMGPVTTR
ncbi:hypothetical protein [Kineosporia sp. A_224]|uniref:hypothetical protein n=1 Tax=Kineosporia sp. A_224 TaxID=1962180 RepID=UPI0018E94D07|nr:hypothetical protein [Kineosporia sp. A_224]